jgi:exopolysaccharide production protein ExoY
MKGKDRLFVSGKFPAPPFYEDKLPFERGIPTLVTVIFQRFLPILLFAIPIIGLIIFASIAETYTQFISAILLGLFVEIFLLFILSLFRQKPTPFDKHLKRLFDISSSLASLLILAPLILIIALLIKIDSRGPILVSQIRLGKDGREFKVLKFRTTKCDSAVIKAKSFIKEEALYIIGSDLTITNVGKFLRMAALDELPQLINVLRGEMSLVGPRAILPDQLDNFDDEFLDDYKKGRPGLTGLWQVESRDATYDERIELEGYYLKNWSFRLDLMILLRTIPAVLYQKGA